MSPNNIEDSINKLLKIEQSSVLVVKERFCNLYYNPQLAC